MPPEDDTRIEEVPPDETGQVPVTFVRVEPRWYGVTPTGSLAAVGAAAAGVGVILLVLGSTAPGVVLLIGGLLALAAALRGPAVAALAGPFGLARTTLATRQAASRRVATLRRELDELVREREGRLRALGEAVYAGNDAATDTLREELAELESRADEKRSEVERTVNEANEQIRRARLEVSATQSVPLEPYPPPDEADPPEQPRIPEPYPPPDEGDIPEPPAPPQPDPERES
ncbi:MAG: hypothetical protein WD689_06960 [Gaiellaceae bacterium]